MQPWSSPMVGRFEDATITSELLRENRLGDPHERPIWVYLPPGYDDKPDRRYPAISLIQGLTGQPELARLVAGMILIETTSVVDGCTSASMKATVMA